jgi:hypothetical protein
MTRNNIYVLVFSPGKLWIILFITLGKTYFQGGIYHYL